MPSRHRSRERALQVLFQIDLTRQTVEDAIRSYYDTFSADDPPQADLPDPFMEELVRGTAAGFEEIDRRISGHSDRWRLDRMPAVDRNVLRMAIHEMTAGYTPPAVVINEALELARRFSGEEAIPFINGVLDAIRREIAPQADHAGG